MNEDPKALLARYQPKEARALKTDRQLCALRFSPCGKVLAAGSQDATVRRWDASTDQFAELPALTGHNGWVQALAFHADGKRLFSADSWGQIRCWPYTDTDADAKPLWALESAHDGWLRALALSPDGKLLASAGMDRKVRLWSVDDGKKVQELAGPDDVFSVAFHPDGKSLVSGDAKGVVREWDLAAGKTTREFDARVLHKLDRIQDVGGVRCLVFDRSGAILIAAGTAPKGGGFVQGVPTIVVFDGQSGKARKTLQIGADTEVYVHDLHLHADGFLIAVTSGQPGNGRFFFQRPEDAQPFFITPKLANCHALAIHPNGTRLAVASTNGGSSGNGRSLMNGEYPGNFSPVTIFDIPPAKG